MHVDVPVHDFLRERKDAILRSWERRVLSETREIQLVGAALRDDVPALLDALAVWLAGGEPPETSSVAAAALRHVLQRLDEGLSLAQVFREYRLLRETIIEAVLEAEGAEQTRAGASGEDGRIARIKDLARLNAGLDVVLSQSVGEFVEERDRRAALERARADRAIRESEERYRTLFETIDEGFCIIEVLFDDTGKPNDYRFVDVNPAFEQHTGLVNARGKRIRELVPQHDEHWFQTYGRVATTGEAIRFENRAEAMNRDYEVYAFRVGGPDRRRVALLFTDVSARKRAEEAQRAGEKRQAFLLRLADGLRGLSDARQIKSTATRILGEQLGADRVLYAEHVLKDGQDHFLIQDVFHRPDHPFPDGLYPLSSFGRDAYEAVSGRTVVVEDVFGDPGLPPPVKETFRSASIAAYAGVPLMKGGRFVALMGMHQAAPRVWRPDELDLLEETAERTWAAVERARAEEALREANDRLVTADRRKTEFLALLSHELRNPLAPIRNGIYLLERAAPDGEQARRAREVVRRQTEHLTRLVDDLLDVTRISHGKIPLDLARVDLREIVRKTTDDLHSVFAQAGIGLRVDFVTVGPIWVEADATRIAQVLANLLNNSVKFTPSGGTVRVSVAARDGVAELSVADDGVGMEPKDIDHMFDAFAQADHTLARTKGGLGLGLALVKSIVELHGGTVSARSDGPGRGSEFLFRLPLAVADSKPDTARHAPARVAPKTILLIEDNVDGAQSLAEILELHGHHVRVAHDGRAGIALARELRPEVVLCDIGLPDVDGFEVARRLRRAEALRGTRLVALSGYAQAEDRQRAREAGFDAHLAKPADLEELMKALASLE